MPSHIPSAENGAAGGADGGAEATSWAYLLQILQLGEESALSPYTQQ